MSVTDLGPWEQELLGDESVVATEAEFASPRLVRHVRADGTTLAVEISARALVFENRPAQLVLAHDVSQRRQLEETLGRAVKMRRSAASQEGLPTTSTTFSSSSPATQN